MKRLLIALFVVLPITEFMSAQQAEAAGLRFRIQQRRQQRIQNRQQRRQNLPRHNPAPTYGDETLPMHDTGGWYQWRSDGSYRSYPEPGVSNQNYAPYVNDWGPTYPAPRGNFRLWTPGQQNWNPKPILGRTPQRENIFSDLPDPQV